MDKRDTPEIFGPVVSAEEWRQIPSEIGKKLESFVVDRIEELCRDRALSETARYDADQRSNAYKTEVEVLSKDRNDTALRLTSATNTIAELESQISIYTKELNKLQEQSSQLEAHTVEFRKQRDLAVDERDELLKKLERRTSELERMQTELTAMTGQLQSAVNAKCEAMANVEEVASMKLNIEYRERHLEQTTTLLNNQLAALNEDLNKRTEELLNVRRDNTTRVILLETKLASKTEELKISNDSLRSLNEVNNSLTVKAEDLAEKLLKQREVVNQTYESYQHELDAQTKEAQLYKEMLNDSKMHAEELTKGIYELQNLLRNATEQFGDLETKHKELELSHDEIVGKKNECIDMLKKELEVANEILKNAKDSNVQREVEGLSPAAASTSRLIRTGMSLTQIYAQYSSVLEELQAEKDENRRLNSYINKIIEEIEDKAPLLRKQREDYEHAMETIAELTKQNDNLIIENHHLHEDNSEAKRLEGSATRENGRLKKEVADLSRQVCHLLREVEHSRAGSSSTSMDQDLSDSTSSADIITKKLVTFNDVSELQSNNKQLLALVRDLSTKQEDAEGLDPASIAELKRQLDEMREKHADMLERQERQDKMLHSIITQREMYKTLYKQAMKSSGNDDGALQLDRSFSTAAETSGSLHSPKPSEDSVSDKAMQELENKLTEANKEIEKFKEEYDTYKKEKTANEKILVEQMDKMRDEVRELTKSNFKLSTTSEYNDERFKILKTNLDVYKNQIATLEEKNKNYNSTIIKHEQSIMHLKDETLNAQTRLSKAEVIMGNLKQENQLLKDSESRLINERRSVHRDSQAQSILLNNIELIKATLERNEAEAKIRVEVRLDEAIRECSALRRRLQEEQDRFRELSDHLERQTQAAQQRMEEEKLEAVRLRDELSASREELVKKTNQLEELSKKLKNNILPSGVKTGSDEERIKELENLLNESRDTVASLTAQMSNAKDQIIQYCSIAEGSEKQVKDISEHHEQFKELTDVKLKECQVTIRELQEKCNELGAELSLQNDGQKETTYDLKNKLSQLDGEHRSLLEELEETKNFLQSAKDEMKQMSASLKLAEEKYAHEMVLHSNDLQSLTTLKADLSKVSLEVLELQHAREEAVDALNANKESWSIREKLFSQEKVDIERRLKDLEIQNGLLLDQIQAFNTQLAVIHAQATGDISMNQSIGGETSFNRSFTEDEVKASEQLLKIIKYLRKEKDISVSKCDILDAENLRLKTQYESTNKQLEETKAALQVERQQSEVSIVTAVKHSEVLRKVETLNAITDSNRILRSERDALLVQIKELSIRTNSLEEQLAPLQELNRELSQKAESAQTENVSLRAEATRWRQRANILIEKSNRTSPEDWKKLNNEKDQLAKHLATEKETHRKLNEELIYARQNKERLEDQLNHLQEKCRFQEEELKRQSEELIGIKQHVQKVTHDLQESKTNLSKLTADNTKITEELGAKDAVIADTRNQFNNMRKIAKRYKTQYEELAKVVEDDNQKKKEREESGVDQEIAADKQEQLRDEGRKEVERRIIELERLHGERLTELNSQIGSSTEETKTLQQEVNELKKINSDKDERAKMLLKSAKSRIVDLTETIKVKNVEIDRLNKLIEGSDENKDSGDGSSNSTMQLDMARLEKEKSDILLEKQQERERLNREIDSLTQRVNQLQRHIGTQQGSKPSTSSSSSDKPTSEPPTANIKPMSGHSNTQTQSVTVTPWRSSSSTGGETPLASIRPMSMGQNVRTAAVLPTSQQQQQSTSCMVPPQQQVVHTTGNSTIEIMSSSPTSSHTDYMPATSSASAAMLGPRQVAVPPTQSNQDSGEDDGNVQVQQATPQPQAIALVLPRVEIPSGGSQEQGTSSSSSSNTVTTTQAGLKRPRDPDTDSQGDETPKAQPQVKRTRVQTGTAEPFQGVSESGIEVEYQVPTSSQRDQEDDLIVLSEEDDGPDEGEGCDDAEPDDADGEGYDMEPCSYEREQELNYEDDVEAEMDEQDAIPEVSNEVEVIEDSSEVPNQSSSSSQLNTSDVNSQQESLSHRQGHPEATSSGVEQQAAGSSMNFGNRTRQVAPLSRQQQQGHLVLSHHGHGGHTLEEGGDDGIVPSTPTLFVPRRTDGFGEAVSSPHVPSSGRFTFAESVPNVPTGSERIVEDGTMDLSQLDDSHSSRSVPSTPQQTSPQESGPSGEEQLSHHQLGQDQVLSLPILDLETETIDSPTMGPPLNQTASTSTLSATSAGLDNQPQSDCQLIEMLEGEDGVSSEGEKTPSGSGEEEGREAEASEAPSSNTRSRGNRGNNFARRANRMGFNRSNNGGGVMPRGGMNRPTPIVWGEHQMQQGGSPRDGGMNRGRGVQDGQNRGSFGIRTTRRSRARPHRTPFSRY